MALYFKSDRNHNDLYVPGVCATAHHAANAAKIATGSVIKNIIRCSKQVELIAHASQQRINQRNIIWLGVPLIKQIMTTSRLN